MFQFYDITEKQRSEINIWADSVIEVNKEAMSSGGDYLIWSNRLYYQPGKDTWVDESWWIETAKQRFIKHREDYNGLGTAVIPALEILVHYFPEQYTEYARDKIDRWYDEIGYSDPEYWFDLILGVYPEHPVTEFLLEEQENTWESSIAIKLGDRKTIAQTKDNILSSLEENDSYWAIENLNKFNNTSFYNIFSQSESNNLELAMIQIAEKSILLNKSDFHDLASLLKSAIELGWTRTIDYLFSNINYLTQLLDLLLEDSYSTCFLIWSLTDKHKLTENLVFQLYPKISSWQIVRRTDFPSYEFGLAIAWKRSQSKT
jgi:hypothetical protein